MALATNAYKIAEQQTEMNKQNAVLVSATSIKDLRNAYPNYFTDIGEFVRKITALVNDK